MLALPNDRFQSFLASSGLSSYTISFLAGDASPRHYFRISTPTKTYVLMDSPLIQSNQDFIQISNLLIQSGFSAPTVIACSTGLILLEDLGDSTFTTVLKKSPDLRHHLYQLATQTTIALSQSISDQPHDVPVYSLDKFLQGVTTFLDWYYPAAHGSEISTDGKTTFVEMWISIFHEINTLPKGLMLRDFHVDNLIYLNNRPGHQACGLLDFQDACWGPAVYDFVSLVDDVRVNLDDSLVNMCWQTYLTAFPDLDRNTAQKLSVSRLIRILGGFVRLDRRDGKSHYLNHLPRTWELLDQNLTNPALKPIKDWFDTWIHSKQVTAS